MLTSPELKDSIEHITTSKVAIVGFCDRLARELEAALIGNGVAFHAVNDQAPYCDPSDTVVKLVLRAPSYYGQLAYKVSTGLGVDEADYDTEPSPCFTTLTDSEVAVMANEWAKLIAGHSQHLVFRNLYVPKSIEVAEGYNNLKVAFRVCRAFDVVRCGYVIRFDAVFKNLAT